MRHPKPQQLIEWEQARMPRCCHTCEHYDQRGVCTEHDAEPPEDFAAQDGACPEYFEEIPF